jgi:hypothetical protein
MLLDNEVTMGQHEDVLGDPEVAVNPLVVSNQRWLGYSIGRAGFGVRCAPAERTGAEGTP